MAVPRPSVGLLISYLSFAVVGCGGGYSSPAPQPSPGPSVISSMQGSWELQFHSDSSSSNYVVLEANLTQTGTKIFAGAAGALVYQGKGPQTSIPLTVAGGNCASGGASQVTVDGVLSNQQSSTETFTFTVTESGASGTSVISASASTDGSSILNGTFTVPAACGFPADHGTFTGYKDTVAFATEAYSGTLNSSTDVIVANFTSKANSFDLTLSGTDNGAQFVLNGSTVGFSLNLAGDIAGRAINWFALYDTTYNTFLIYDANFHLLGSLHPGSGPFDYIRTIHNP